MREVDEVDSSYYHSRASLERDLLLIVENCKRYNEAGSELVREAEKLQEATSSLVARCFDGFSIPEVTFSPLAVDTRLDAAVDRVISWLEATLRSFEVPASLRPLVLDQNDKIALCKRPLFLSTMREKQSLHFYAALSELFVGLREAVDA